MRQLVVEGKRIDETALPEARTAWLTEAEQIVELEIDHDGYHFLYRLECLQGKRDPEVRERLAVGNVDLYRSSDGKVELFGDGPTPAPRATIPFERRRSFIAVLESRHDNRRIMLFRTAIESIWRLKPDPVRIGSTAAGESDWLAPDLSNFADWYRAKVQEDPEASVALQVDLRNVLVGFVQLRLEALTQRTRELRVRFDFGKSTHELSWLELSEGQRLLIALYGFLRFAGKQATLLALDEIDNYVALPVIQPWLRSIVDVMLSKNGQLAVISHHPESIDYLAADAVWVMSRDRLAGHTRISRPEPDRDAGETASAAVMSGATGNA
ncbi:MAG TPA: AAA family ATPase [Kofleriaceae bacterium]|nr:AAA family ATPase [Kofleriaceae bacterium]